MSLAPRTRVLLALALVLLAALAVLWQGRDSVADRSEQDSPHTLAADAWVGSAARALAPLSAHASSAALGAAAALAIDGRSGGSLPYAWQAAADDRAPWLALRFRSPMALTAVLVRDFAADGAVLSLDGISLGAPRRVGTMAWWQVPAGARAVSELRLAGVRSVSEIVPVYVGADSWLLLQSGHDDWTAEWLTGHGVRPLAAIPAALLDELPRLARSPGRLVLPNEACSTGLTDSLRGLVAEGWTLLELGPNSGVCGAASNTAPAQRHELRAQDDERFHWVGGLANHVPCAACTSGETLLSTSAGQAAFVAELLGKGRCLRWLGDFSDSLRRLRQGAPERAGQDRIGADGLKPADLLVDDLQPADYRAPHADRLVERTLAALAPTQRLYLLPPELPALLIMTADQDYVPDAAVLGQLEEMSEGTASLLLTDATLGTAPDVDFKEFSIERLARASAARLQKRGHSAGIHASLLHLPGGSVAYQQTLIAHAAAFQHAYGAAPRIARNHHLVWNGFVTMAESQARAGIAMNLDYVALAYRGRAALGFMNGSALPLRFAAPDDTLIPIYQQGTQLDDHVLIDASFGYEPLQVEDLVAVQRGLLDQALRDDPHVIVVNHHPAWWHATNGSWQRALLADARARKIAVWDAARWLLHVEAVRETLIDVSDQRSICVVTGASDVALLLPAGAHASVAGRRLPARSRRVGGTSYAFITVPASSNLQLDIEP